MTHSNMQAPAQLLLANDLALASDGWALLAPYGEHRKERLVQRDGQLVRETFIQQVDEAVVDALLANERGLLQRAKRFFIRQPVYRGHPDLAQLSPETLTGEARQALAPIGLVERYRKTPRGFEARFALTEAGALVVQNERCEFPSILWSVLPTGEVRDGAVVVRPSQILSVGLTPTPNISGVDSLANAKPNHPAANPDQTADQTDPMKQTILGWLAGKGHVLANEATEPQVITKLNEVFDGLATRATTLGNEQSTLTTRFTALENEKGTLTTERDGLKTQLAAAQTALANEQTTLKSERTARFGLAVDLAITQGKVTPADRETEITALGNSTDLPAALAALAARPVKHNVAGNEPRKAGAAAEQLNPSTEILRLANSDPRYTGIADYGTAYQRILADHPALAAALQPAAAPTASAK